MSHVRPDCHTPLTMCQSSPVPSHEAPQHDASIPPFHSPHSETHRNFTPSISPLSTTSGVHNEYFGDTNHPRPSPPVEPSLVDAPYPIADTSVPDDVVMRDDRSSSLSDFEGNFEDQQPNQDANDDAATEDADSEAETERLEHSPQKAWKSADVGPTPSKLNQETTAEDDLSDPASSPRSPPRDPQSPSPTHRFKGALAPQPHHLSLPQLIFTCLASPPRYAGEKRKRSTPTSSGDSPLTSDAESDSEHLSPPPHANGITATTAVKKVVTGDSPDDAVDDTAIDAPDDDAALPRSTRETPEQDDQDELDENPYISPMKAARLKGKKQRAKRQKESAIIQKPNYEAEYDDTMDLDELQDDDDSAAKTDEDRENKKQAQAEYNALAEKFHIFRTK